eukprot:COSAG01_NODE_5598_length_4155_cov_11.499014_2_plen_149_part_00
MGPDWLWVPESSEILQTNANGAWLPPLCSGEAAAGPFGGAGGAARRRRGPGGGRGGNSSAGAPALADGGRTTRRSCRRFCVVAAAAAAAADEWLAGSVRSHVPAARLGLRVSGRRWHDVGPDQPQWHARGGGCSAGVLWAVELRLQLL